MGCTDLLLSAAAGAPIPGDALRAGWRDHRVLTGHPALAAAGQKWRHLLLYSYTVQPPGYPAHNEFGYAITELRWGWSALHGVLAADAPPRRE